MSILTIWLVVVKKKRRTPIAKPLNTWKNFSEVTQKQELSGMKPSSTIDVPSSNLIWSLILSGPAAMEAACSMAIIGKINR